MSRASVLGAGGVQSDWAIWAGKNVVAAIPIVPEREEEPQKPLADSDVNVEMSVLKARTELLERENELLRQRLAIADRQVEVKDSQINDFKAITDNLARQNQVLLMLTQGVPIERILKGGAPEIAAEPRHIPNTRAKAQRLRGSAVKVNEALRGKIASRLRELVQTGITQRQIAETFNEEGIPTLSGVGKWDRRKIGKFAEKVG